MSATQIKSRIRSGLLTVEYPGVYRVGAPTTESSYLAAVRTCGPGSALSGLGAAWLWGLTNGRPPPPEVSAPIERRIEGIDTRRRRLHPSERTLRRGIPTTSVPLTLLDLAPLLAPDDLGQACHRAGTNHRVTPGQVAEAIARRPNAKGAAKLRRILEGEPISLSRLESEFLALLRAHDLPLPITNRPAGEHRVDCRWPSHKLTVELDSYRFHNSCHSWEADRKREREAYARGDEHRRYGWSDVFEDRRAMLRELFALLLRR